MTDNKKKKSFLKMPEYPGGKEEFKKFVANHLKYPQEALSKKIEGMVQLKVEINYDGNVSEISVEHGLGYGCDEEAVRVAKLLKFGEVRNRGVKVKATKKVKIQFKLPAAKTTITYEYKAEAKKQPKVSEQKTKKPEVKYTYTIKF